MIKKVISVTESQSKKRDFCQTDLSRVDIANKSLLFRVPPFDLANFRADLPDLYNNSKSIVSLVENIRLLYDTYFYPTTIVSLALIEDGKVSTVINSNSTALERSNTDWAIDDKTSITSELLQQEPGTIFSFADVSGRWVSDFRRITPDFDKILNIQNPDDKQISLNEHYIPFDESGNSNFDILRKEQIVNTEAETLIASGILAPLRIDDKVNGVIFIGTNAFHLYTYTAQNILGLNDIPNLQLLIDHVSLTLDKLTREQKNMSGV